MREVKDNDYCIKVEGSGKPTLSDLIDGANYVLNIVRNGSNLELAPTTRLFEDYIELIDYLYCRLDSADAARFN